MSTHPRLEARVSAQEKLVTILAGRIEELNQDMAESFRQQAVYQVNLERKMDAHFAALEAKIDALETRMETNMKGMEARMLHAFQQLVIMVAAQRSGDHPGSQS